LLHISSLPGEYGIGDLGPEAYEFANLLVRLRQRYWQILPLNPPAGGLCPYSCLSAFAGNPLLISPELMCRDGLVTIEEIADRPESDAAVVDWASVAAYKERLLCAAYERFRQNLKRDDYEAFCQGNADWLDDFALFAALREHFSGRSWCDWPADVRDRRADILDAVNRELKPIVEKQKFIQFVFYRQWLSLKEYCNRRGLVIIGDMPIYVAFDSADVWVHPEIFKLTEDKRPRFVAGAPPDYFSKSGQLWGNPVYDWDRLKVTDYAWWIRRVEHNLRLFDIVRVDHFRGLVGYWEIPADRRTAKSGKWVKARPADFFEKLFARVDRDSIIVEDLGHITADVRSVIARFGLCGMRILQFGFDGGRLKNSHTPFNHHRNCVVYTGTHDNNTVHGWFAHQASAKQKKRLFDSLGREVPVENVHWEMIRLAMNSVANVAIIQMQDVLGLGAETRMNRPGTVDGNWQWRLAPEQIDTAAMNELARMTRVYSRG
jgi:4-alpha-glucanotransferase